MYFVSFNQYLLDIGLTTESLAEVSPGQYYLIWNKLHNMINRVKYPSYIAWCAEWTGKELINPFPIWINQ